MNLVLEDAEGNEITVLDLHEAVASIDAIGTGEIFPVYIANRGDSKIRMITIELQGEERNRAQIAMNTGEDPIWADPGMSLIFEGVLDPERRFGILARGLYDPHDTEGRYNLGLTLRGTAF
jgi:hypothetical protein